MPKHLIFEGAELAGKSWLMSRVYDYLEPKYNKSAYVLDGCHWFNADNGVFGTKNSREVIEAYIKIFQALKENNLIVEKFTLSDEIYQKLYQKKDFNYKEVNKKLKELDFKIILITFPENEEKLKKRIKDRLNLYPHYKNILKDPAWYIKQQKMYKEKIKTYPFSYLRIDTDFLPDESLVKKIISWIEKK
jgi:thymidylate kinase